MDISIENAILPFKLQQFVAFIMEKKRFSLKDALCYLYGTELYNKLMDSSAKMWAIIKRNREVEPNKAKAIVSVYEVDDDILSKDYRIHRFNGATFEWLDFVIGNRKGNKTELFDMVMGPVANDKLYATLLLYEQGILTAGATIEQLKTHTLFDQLSFHSTEALKELRFLSSEEVG